MNDQQILANLRSVQEENARMQAQLGALARRYKALKGESEETREALKKAAKRLRYIEDIPGKRVPYFMQFTIDIPGPTEPSITIAGTQLTDSKTVSMDGPFVCTQYLGAFLMRTFSIGSYTDPQGPPGNGRPNDPPAGTEVITPLTGRFRPIASTADPFSGAYIGAQVGPITVPGAQAVQTFKPGTCDFIFEIQDNSSDRNRQNQIPIPSRYIFSEFDRPLYLPTADFFERGTTITFKPTLTHDLGFAEVNYAQLPNNFAEGDQQPPPDPAQPNNIGRVPVAIGGTLYFTMLGYKVIQAQSPAV